jgi:DNA-binding NtrC family response regulator
LETESPLVLVVDDEPLNRDLLEQELEGADLRTLPAGSGEEALALAAARLPDLILLDVRMRGLDGYETCRRLKASEVTRAIPVIFLTAVTDTFEKVRAFDCGAVDYVTKPFEPAELLARVGVHLALRREVEAHGRSKATLRALVDDMRSGVEELVGSTPGLGRVRELISQVAPTDSTVLIQGETGTGKELVARAIHAASGRRERALIKLNCAALPRELVESELFGHEKGAFTGAVAQRRGRFELADGATLLLDEVGELPLEAQAKLLRVLQEHEFERVGGARCLRSDVRVIAATNRDLSSEVASGRFRADLYYRLNVFPIHVPPLRERRDDIPLLIEHFAGKTARRLGRRSRGVSAAFVARARAYGWPGNIRELENLVERAMITSPDGVLDGSEFLAPSDVTPCAADLAPAVSSAGALDEVERAHIRRVLEDTGWVIEGEGGAARILGLNPSTLRGRLRKLGIHRA